MRKSGLLTTLLMALLFYPLSALTLGLGEIEVDSFLNQPLRAEIEVISARPDEVGDLLVSLASRDAFRKAGLERSAGLSKLRFTVVKSEDGETATIKVTTKTPVKEPFLNFLVEADWAKGRLLREFTVLLDPPYFTQQTTAPEAVVPVAEEPQAVAPQTMTPDVIASDTAATTEQPKPALFKSMTFKASDLPPKTPGEDNQDDSSASQSQPIAMSTNQDSVADQGGSYDDSYQGADLSADEIEVEKGDTLWSIASRYEDGEHSMSQIMLAMQMMNPEAFNQNNINNLKVGAILRAPDADTLNALNKQEAHAEVLQQNGLWDEYVARVSGSAVAGSPSAIDSDEGLADESTGETGGQLSLVTPGEGDSLTASLQNDSTAQDSDQIRKQLAFAEEELEAARLQNDDMQSRISDLEQQLSKFEELQKLIQIEDDSLAQLQEKAAEETISEEMMVEAEPVSETDEEGMSGEVEEKPSDVMVESADAILTEQVDDQITDETPDQSSLDILQDSLKDLPSTEAEDVIDTLPEKEGMEAEDELTSEPVPAPVIITEAPSEVMGGDFMDMLPPMDELLSDPIILGGGVAILALLLGFLFILLRRLRKDDDDTDVAFEDFDDDDITPIHVASAEDIQDQVEEGEVDTHQDIESDLSDLDTEQHMADTISVEAEEKDDFSSTVVLSEAERPTEQPPADEQDDTLNEVDVYLAYGLYDNAEELLKESLQNSPDRADYRAKLLDTYFATHNLEAFVNEAEALKSLGNAANRYWDRVQIMGFELAPDNALFKDAKDSDLSVADLEYAKPETADFNIGADDDITDFSSTDFNLGGDTEVIESIDDDYSETQSLDTAEVQPDLDGEDGLEGDDLPDEIADFDFNLGDDDEIEEPLDEVNLDEDALNFNLPEDLDLSVEDEDSLIQLDPTLDAPDLEAVPSIDDDLADVPDDGLDELMHSTIAMESLAGEVVDPEDMEPEGTLPDLTIIDPVEAEPTDVIPAINLEDENDDITEFKPAGVTGEFPEFNPDLDEVAEEIDVVAGGDRTDTFAPGDFIDEDLGIDLETDTDITNIEDLMLPDDVDEVGTKLDLAKAFIDMGDTEGARSSLEEVLTEGTQEQKAEATGLMDKIK